MDTVIGTVHDPGDFTVGGTGIGLIVPFDMAQDREIWRWTPTDVTWYVTRLPWKENTAVGVEWATAVADHEELRAAVTSVAFNDPAVTAFGCTSSSFVGGVAGEARLRDAMRLAGAREAVTTTGAILAALDVLGARRVGLVTPYTQATAVPFVETLHEYGKRVLAYGFLGLDRRIELVAAPPIRRLCRQVASRARVDALVISCTNLRTFDLVTDLEDELGVPVVTANQATVWQSLVRAGRTPPSTGQALMP